jgi:hypothetical protein
MTISDWLVIIAILLAPLVAIQIQKYMENNREKRNRKMNIFRTLMATRGFPLNPQHVEALNMIDIEFYKNQKVVDTWKLLLDNYLNFPKDPKEPNFQSRLDACVKASNELLADLLYEMANALNYSFDKVHLKRGVYIPKGHTDIIVDQEIIRRSLVSVFLGQLPIPIKIINSKNEGKAKEDNKKEK